MDESFVLNVASSGISPYALINDASVWYASMDWMLSFLASCCTIESMVSDNESCSSVVPSKPKLAASSYPVAFRIDLPDDEHSRDGGSGFTCVDRIEDVKGPFGWCTAVQGANSTFLRDPELDCSGSEAGESFGVFVVCFVAGTGCDCVREEDVGGLGGSTMGIAMAIARI